MGKAEVKAEAHTSQSPRAGLNTDMGKSVAHNRPALARRQTTIEAFNNSVSRDRPKPENRRYKPNSKNEVRRSPQANQGSLTRAGGCDSLVASPAKASKKDKDPVLVKERLLQRMVMKMGK